MRALACVAAVGVLIHGVLSLIYHDRDCRRCDGASRFYQNDKQKFSHPCRKCGGSGKKTRMGARVWRRILGVKR